MVARGLGVLVVAAVLLGVTACGDSSPSGSTTARNGEASKSGKQVVRDATRAALGASSFRVSGQFNDRGQQTALDLTILKGEKGVKGSVTLAGQKFEVMIVGHYAYMKAGVAFWTQHGPVGRTIAHLAADKWTKFSGRSRWNGLWVWLADTATLFRLMSRDAGTAMNEGATTYNGQSVVNITDGPGRGTLYVSATGTAYPVALVKAGVGSGNSLTFDSWNKPVTLAAPSGAIDISQR